MPEPWAQARSQLALATRYGADEQKLAELRRDLRAARLEKAIQQAVSEAPPLTDTQRARSGLDPAPDRVNPLSPNTMRPACANRRTASEIATKERIAMTSLCTTGLRDQWAWLTNYSLHRPNPAPGEPEHDHWGDKRPREAPKAEWRAYGDRYPGSYCRWLTDTDAGQAALAQRRREDQAAALWLRVQRTVRAFRQVSA